MASITGSFTVTVVPTAAPLALTPPSAALPQETVGSPTSDKVTVISGGVPPYTINASGTLPPGVTLLQQPPNSDGSVNVVTSGTPSEAGSFSFTVAVTDSGS